MAPLPSIESTGSGVRCDPDVPPGHYRNPVLDEDWPDPDVIRHDGEYLMVASSFNRAPGLPVLRSADLVHWEIAAHALPAVPPQQHFALPRHGGGVWAPSIRAHQGRLHVVWPDPDHGLWVSTAPAAEGPWAPPHLLLPGQGLIDPCPLWDTDGRTYLVHGWAGSRSAVKNRLTVLEVSADLTTVLAPGRTVIDGADLPGYRTLEGPKLYRRGGWYWIFAPAGGVATGWQAAFRSRSIYGPYEHRTILAQGSSPVNGPHQGAWVSDPSGADWFVHFQDRGAYGRVTHLQPMHWDEAGWPVLGRDGEPVATHPAPVPASEARGTAGDHQRPVRAARPWVRAVDGSDDFTGPLQPKWHWQANPGPGWARTGEGHLDLHPVANDLGDLRLLPQLLGQQLPGVPCTFRTSVHLAGGTEGTRTGLVLLGAEYAWIGLELRGGLTHLVCRRSSQDDSADRRRTEAALVDELLPAASEVWLQLRSDGAGSVELAWATTDPDGSEAAWTTVAQRFTATPGQWIGAEVALFAAAPVGTAAPGGPGGGAAPAARYGSFDMSGAQPASEEGS